jgi:hypothetical protein
MLNETAAQLVHLAHPNGWWRHGAAVARAETGQVGGPGTQRSRLPQNLLERFHALWTLEGLGALDPAIARR